MKKYSSNVITECIVVIIHHAYQIVSVLISVMKYVNHVVAMDVPIYVEMSTVETIFVTMMEQIIFEEHKMMRNAMIELKTVEQIVVVLIVLEIPIMREIHEHVVV